MDLSKIKTLIDFVGQSRITELSVTEKGVTVRIFRSTAAEPAPSAEAQPKAETTPGGNIRKAVSTVVEAPIFGVLHRASAPGQPPFVKLGDVVEQGQTLFIIEAMKVFNTITAPRAGRIERLTEIDGGEVQTGDLLAEIV